VWSSILGFGVCVLGLIASFVIALRRGMRPAQR
jgi:hypothetical protein